MHHFVTYNRQTGEITGAFRNSSTEFLPTPISSADANLQVTNPQHIAALQAAFSSLQTERTAYRVGGKVVGREITELATKPLYDGRIHLTTNVAPRRGSGHPEIPADGQSVVRITATFRHHDRRRLDHADQQGSHQTLPATISFRTDRGALSRRTVEIVDGAAHVELRSVTETVNARVTAFAKGFQPGNLTVEFIPPDEFEETKQDGPEHKR